MFFKIRQASLESRACDKIELLREALALSVHLYLFCLLRCRKSGSLAHPDYEFWYSCGLLSPALSRLNKFRAHSFSHAGSYVNAKSGAK